MPGVTCFAALRLVVDRVKYTYLGIKLSFSLSLISLPACQSHLHRDALHDDAYDSYNERLSSWVSNNE